MESSKFSTLKQAMARPLSGEDMNHLVRNTPIHIYSDLERVKRFDELFNDNGVCFLLYLIENDHSGHWVCLQNGNEVIEFFDSYGGNGRPDSQLRWVPPDKRADWGEDSPLLMRLIRQTGKRLVYNTAKLQSQSNTVATCGRHCAVRLMHATEPLTNYVRWLESNKASPDEIVTEITYRILGH